MPSIEGNKPILKEPSDRVIAAVFDIYDPPEREEKKVKFASSVKSATSDD